MNDKLDNVSLDGLIVDSIGRQTFDRLLMEATTSVEQSLAIEDKGWINLTLSGTEITSAKRIENIKYSRIYYNFDPLVSQAIRLWTDYTFGPGMSWEIEEENKQTKNVLESFWYSSDNQPIFGSRGQRRCSDKLLVDGEIFFALFLGKESRIRTIDPLEITEIITDPDDIEHPMFYKRDWIDRQSSPHTDYYRSHLNIKNQSTKDSLGAARQKTQDALVYHLSVNTIGQRGNPLGLSGFDWLKQYRRFLAARVAMMLARSRFTWKQKIGGGQSALSAVKAATQDKTPDAGSILIENQAIDTQPIQTPQDAKNAYDDARLLKLQLCSAFGIPEQYFGDIACYSQDTEVLTDKGWMLHKDWLERAASTKIASYDPDMLQVEYLYPNRLNMYEYNGQMVHFKNAQTDILVTPNHRMWTAPKVAWELQPPRSKPCNGGRRSISEGGVVVVDRSWRVEEAQQITNHSRAAGWMFTNTVIPTENPAEIDTFNTHDPEAWALFIGYFLSEGYTLSDKKKNGDDRDRVFYRVAISQKEGQILDNMRTTIRRLGWNYHEQRNQSGVVSLTIVNKELWYYLRNNCGTNSHTKHIPREFFSSSYRQRRELLIALLQGDGGKANGMGTGGWRYSSASKQLADDVMELTFSLGYATSVTKEIKGYNGSSHEIWRVAIRDKRKGTHVKTKHIKSEPYNGKVYCFALPKNHIYITRRNGKVAIQGNTGNLATAKTVELPMLKMFQSYQAVWSDAFQDIFEIVFEHNRVSPDTWYVDKDFPTIAPEDAMAAAQAIGQIIMAFPEFASVADVQQAALMAIGINDPSQVLEQLTKEAKSDPTIPLTKALRAFRKLVEAKK